MNDDVNINVVVARKLTTILNFLFFLFPPNKAKKTSIDIQVYQDLTEVHPMKNPEVKLYNNPSFDRLQIDENGTVK